MQNPFYTFFFSEDLVCLVNYVFTLYTITI